MAAKLNPTEARKFYQQVARWHLGQAKTAVGRGDTTLADLHWQAGLAASERVKAMKSAPIVAA